MLAALALSSSLVWGTTDFAGGWLTKRINAIRVVAMNQLTGLAILCVVVLATGAHLPISLGQFGFGLGSGVAVAVGLGAYYQALSTGTMGVVAPIAALGAVVPVVLGLATGDRLHAVVAAGLAVAIVGVVLASGPDLSASAGRRPVLLAILAAICLGLSLFLLDRAATVSVLGGLWAMRLGSGIVLGGLWLGLRHRLRGADGDPGTIRRRDVPSLIGVGVGDLSANTLFAVATGYGAVSIVSVLGSLYPVVTLLLGRVILHERMRPVQTVGVALTVLGVILTTLG